MAIRDSSIVPEVGLRAYLRTGTTGVWVVICIGRDGIKIAQFDPEGVRRVVTVDPAEIDCVE